MAKKVTPLTDTKIKHTKPKDKEYSLSDGDGLSLRIKPSGSKLWIFNYQRPHTKARTNLGFGQYPELSLLEAREKRADARKLLVKDIDPKKYQDEQQKQETEKQTNTFEKVAHDWFAIKKETIKEKTSRDLWSVISTYLLPKLGAIPVSEITAPQAIKVIKPTESSHIELSKRLCQRINEIMTFALNTGLISANPLLGIKEAFIKAPVTHNPTIKPEELPKLMTEIEYSGMTRVVRGLVLFQLHTMCRSSECALAEWSEIDFENETWTIPASRMKMKREHIVPLTPQVLQILESVKVLSGLSKYVFPAQSKLSSHANRETVNNALRRLGYKDKLTGHGLRSLASTTLNEQGFDSDIIESGLAHTERNQVRKAYNHSKYLERRKVMMLWWSCHIQEAKNGKLTTSKNGLVAVI